MTASFQWFHNNVFYITQLSRDLFCVHLRWDLFGPFLLVLCPVQKTPISLTGFGIGQASCLYFVHMLIFLRWCPVLVCLVAFIYGASWPRRNQPERAAPLLYIWSRLFGLLFSAYMLVVVR